MRNGTADIISENGAKSARGESSLPLNTWLDRLAAAHGSPGGGAACALMVAASSALMEMVAGYTADDARVIKSRDRLALVRRRAFELADIDSRRSSDLGDALREANADDDPVPDAALSAAESVLELTELAEMLIPELELLLEVADRYLMPDLVVAAASASAALRGAAATAEADLRLADAHTSEHDETLIGAATATATQIDSARRRFDELLAQASERLKQLRKS